MIRLIEDTRSSLKMSLERFFYTAYFYAELKITVPELLDMVDIYEDEHFVNDVVLDYTYAVMCGLAKPIPTKKN